MGKPLRVLIIDDSDNDALLLLRELRRGGYEPQSERVARAADMHAALLRQNWDIVLSSYTTLHLNAIDALAILKASRLDLPFIIISDTHSEDAVVAAMKAGAHDFMLKGNAIRFIASIERELYEAEKRRKIEANLGRQTALIQLLQKITVTDRHNTDSEATLQNALVDICSALRWQVGHIHILDNVSAAVVAHDIWHLDHPDHLQFKVGLEACSIDEQTALVNQVITSKQSLWIAEAAEAEHLFSQAHLVVTASFRSVLALPLMIGTEVAAVMTFFTTDYAQVDHMLLETLNAISVQLGHRMECSYAKEAYTRLATLHKIDQAILKTQSPETIIDLVLGYIQEQVSTHSISTTLFDFETHEAQILTAPNTDERSALVTTQLSLSLFPAEVLDILRAGHSYMIEDIALLPESNPVRQILEARELRACIWFPLVAQNNLIGVLNLESDAPQTFTRAQIALGRETADQLALALQQARYQEQMKRQRTQLERHVLERTLELQRTKDRIEAVLNSSSDAMIQTTFDGVIQQVNSAFSQMFAYSIDDVFGQSLIMLVSPDEDVTLIEIMNCVVNTMQSKTLEITGQRQDGSTFNGDLALAPVLDDGKIRGIICSIRDITERKQAERALQASEEKYRALVNFAPDPIVIVDEKGYIVLTNQRIESFGYEIEDLIGQPVSLLIPENMYEARMAHANLHFSGGFPHSPDEKLDVPLRHKNGSDIPVKIGLSPIKTDNEQLIMAYIVDVSAQKQLEVSLRAALAKEQELSELRTRFVSMVSHDFRTPLTVIQSSTGILQTYSDRMDEAKKESHFQKILTQVDRMVTMLNDVLAVNQADTATIPIEFEWLDVDQFSQEIVEEFQGNLNMKHTLVYSCSGTPRKVLCNEKLMLQAITNLLTNAFKYSPDGSLVHLKLSFNADNIVIQVKDRGMGIPQADQAHLFEAYHRAGNVGKIQGTGLGLAIVKHAVEAHSGTVTVESQVGRGTTFIMTLPLQQALSQSQPLPYNALLVR